ncbi:MAG TPA: hypothetical protein VEQ35_02025 [Beijerinckia sp.]|nr:hypothetical protein [Beijerinckia sp.]
MKYLLLAATAGLITLGSWMASVQDANAVVCARGVYRAGCAGPRGAVVGHRRYYGPHRYYGARGVYVRRPVGVYRRY